MRITGQNTSTQAYYGTCEPPCADSSPVKSGHDHGTARCRAASQAARTVSAPKTARAAGAAHELPGKSCNSNSVRFISARQRTIGPPDEPRWLDLSLLDLAEHDGTDQDLPPRVVAAPVPRVTRALSRHNKPPSRFERF
jgi:hypothetical protein